MPDSERPRHSRGRRIRKALLWAVVGVVVVIGGLGTWLYTHLSGSLPSVDINAELGTDRPENPQGGSKDILVLGTDSLANAPAETAGAASEATAAPMTDTAMVVHLPGDGGSATVVSFPPGLEVARPDCSPGSTERVAFDSIRQAGGPSCVVRTVEELSDIRMDHYLQVDFGGFADLVDALGGVTVTLDQEVTDEEGGMVLETGTRRLSGAEALTAARSEQDGTADGLGPQQQLLLALIHEVNKQGVLSSPAKLYRVAGAATRSLTTDSELGSLSDLVNFAKELGEVDTTRMTTLALPAHEEASTSGRVVPQQPEADTVWRALQKDTDVPHHLLPDATGRTAD